jgi:hypothetical protein
MFHTVLYNTDYYILTELNIVLRYVSLVVPAFLNRLMAAVEGIIPPVS